MMNQIEAIADPWVLVQEGLKKMFSSDIYSTWFESLELLGAAEGEYTLGVPNAFAQIWIQDNYHTILQGQFQMACGRSVKLKYKVLEKELSEQTQQPINNDPIQPHKPKIDKSFTYALNPRSTFANFVVGSGNQFSHAACVAVANNPALAYNPLFLYGETGLGKTHLMHAIAHHSLQAAQDKKIVYLSTEKFTNEFIVAIQENTLPKFRKRYRSVDILLIDDIHFLSGKERIQEEFFHTFNALYESQKQIVLTSDRPVNEIGGLENRLMSRFQWGLVTDIQAPDLETRMAILSKKAKAMHLELPEAIINFLAERVCRNVRRLEGALNRIAGYGKLVDAPITVSVVEGLLKDILQEEAQERITIQKIQQKVIEYFQLRPSDMQSKRRPAHIAFPRQIAMYLSRLLTGNSLQDIGEAFGGRDHGTVIHACKTVENMMEQDESIKRKIEYLQSHLTGKA